MDQLLDSLMAYDLQVVLAMPRGYHHGEQASCRRCYHHDQLDPILILYDWNPSALNKALPCLAVKHQRLHRVHLVATGRQLGKSPKKCSCHAEATLRPWLATGWPLCHGRCNWKPDGSDGSVVNFHTAVAPCCWP